LGLPSADLLSISSSGEMAISTGRHYTVGWINSGKLARVALDGQVPREVLDDVLCADWSPDGRSLALVRSVAGRYRLEYPEGTVLYETSGWISDARVSPDGQTVAFQDHPLLGDDRGTVAIVDRQRKKTTLSGVWPGEAGLAWAPGGKEIWFTAGDADFYTLRAISLSGKQRVVMRSLGDLELQDISKDGRVLVTSFQRRLGLIGSAPGEGQEHDWSWFDYSLFNNISSDGSKLLFSESSGAGGPLYSVFLRRTDGSPAVRLGDGRGEAISPDGKWVLALVPTSPPQLSLLPTGAGEPRMLSRDSIDYQRAWWFPDGKRILVAGSEPGHSTRFYVRDLEGGKLQPLTPEKVEVSTAEDILSPDGKWVAVSEAGQNARLYPVDGGEPRPISGIAEGDVPIQWTSDGRSLYVRRWDEIPARVFRLDLGTGRRELWKQIMPADHTGVVKISGILPTPDGRAYAYSYLRVLSELYVVEGLK
jgi:Tol biopolymer transport system component